MMQTFLNGLTAVMDFFMMIVQQAWLLYTTVPVFMAILALFIIRKVVDIFGILKN
jgi:hypothetical protein